MVYQHVKMRWEPWLCLPDRSRSFYSNPLGLCLCKNLAHHIPWRAHITFYGCPLLEKGIYNQCKGSGCPLKQSGHCVDGLDANRSTSRGCKDCKFPEISQDSISSLSCLSFPWIILLHQVTQSWDRHCILSAHSTMGASSSAAANVGITASNILKAVDWSSESVFQIFHLTTCHLVERFCQIQLQTTLLIWETELSEI